MFLVVVSWVLVARGGAGELAVVLAVWSVARGTCLLMGGLALDRLPKRPVSLSAGAAMAALSAYLGALTSAHDLGVVPWLGAALLLGATDGVRIPLPTAFLPYLVAPPALARASRVLQTATWAGRAVGPALGGLVVATVGATAAFWTIAAWYAVATLAWALLPAVPRPIRGPAPSIARSFGDGLAFIARQPVLRWLLPVFAADNFFVVGPVNVLLPVLVTRGLHGTAATLGLMNAAYGAGLVVGTLGFGRWPLALRSSMRASLALFWFADALFGLLGLVHIPAVAVAAYGLCGFLIGPASVL